MANLDRLTASVRNIENVADSLDVLVKGMAAQIRATAGDAAAANALADEVDAKAASFAADIVANTPSAPSTPVVGDGDGTGSVAVPE